MPDDRNPRTPLSPPPEWHALAAKVSTERDPKKLTNLINELLVKLDEEERKKEERKKKILAERMRPKPDGQPQ